MAFTVTRTIAAPREQVFEWLSDVTNYIKTPGISRATVTRPGSPQASGVGTCREVRAAGVLFDEEVTSFDPPRSTSYVVRQSKPKLPHRGGTIALSEDGTATRVDWSIDFRSTMPVVGRMVTAVGGAALAPGFRMILATAARELEKKGARA